MPRFRRRAGSLLAGLLAPLLGVVPAAAMHAQAQPQPAAIRPVVTPLSLPVHAGCISSPFGPRILPNRPLAGTFHNGIDLPAPAGAPVLAVAPGHVIRAERRGPGGLELLVQHPGFIGVYSHLGSLAPTISEGHFAIRTGEKLGVVGHSGLTYGMHLFFAMEQDGRFFDPAPYFDLPLCRAAPDRSVVAIKPTREPHLLLRAAR